VKAGGHIDGDNALTWHNASHSLWTEEILRPSRHVAGHGAASASVPQLQQNGPWWGRGALQCSHQTTGYTTQAAPSHQVTVIGVAT
jgi:hypothetical protein